ncbi:MAG TPA: hypothetical protein VK436_06450 [Methanocella sp.]|nr:hypothetical protein [Methanocella sp.]
MKLSQALTYLSILIVITLSGCASPNSSVQPSPQPSATSPTATTSVTPIGQPQGPITIGTINGTQIRLSDIKVSMVHGNGTTQAENFTVVLENTGTDPVDNVGFNFREKDLPTGEQYFSKVYLVGTIPGNGNITYPLTTPDHESSNSVIVDVDIYWGEQLEYKNSYKKSYTLVGMPSG